MDLFWQALAGLIVVVGPWKAGVLFAERTRPLPKSARRRTALMTVVFAASAGLVFILVGPPLLDFFHIGEAAFLIAAGLIVVVFSILMVISDNQSDPVEDYPADPRDRALTLAAYPLSVPLVLTPPGLASLIALGVVAEITDEALLPVIAAFLVVMAVNLVVFLLESEYEHFVSPAILNVAGRLLGVLLVAFGVSIALDGLKELDLIAG